MVTTIIHQSTGETKYDKKEPLKGSFRKNKDPLNKSGCINGQCGKCDFNESGCMPSGCIEMGSDEESESDQETGIVQGSTTYRPIKEDDKFSYKNTKMSSNSKPKESVAPIATINTSKKTADTTKNKKDANYSSNANDINGENKETEESNDLISNGSALAVGLTLTAAALTYVINQEDDNGQSESNAESYEGNNTTIDQMQSMTSPYFPEENELFAEYANYGRYNGNKYEE